MEARDILGNVYQWVLQWDKPWFAALTNPAGLNTHQDTNFMAAIQPRELRKRQAWLALAKRCKPVSSHEGWLKKEEIVEGMKQWPKFEFTSPAKDGFHMSSAPVSFVVPFMLSWLFRGFSCLVLAGRLGLGSLKQHRRFTAGSCTTCYCSSVIWSLTKEDCFLLLRGAAVRRACQPTSRLRLSLESRDLCLYLSEACSSAHGLPHGAFYVLDSQVWIFCNFVMTVSSYMGTFSSYMFALFGISRN